MHRPRVLIDATELTNQFRFRGVGNLTFSLLRNLLQNKDIDWQLMAPGNKQQLIEALGYHSAAELPYSFEFHSLGNGPESFLYKLFTPVYYYLKVLPLIKRVQPELCLFINSERGIPLDIPTLVFVHDVIPYKTGKYSQKNWLVNQLKKFNYSWAIKRAKQAKQILTISQFTKQDLISVGFRPENITIVPLAISAMVMREVEKLGQSLYSDQNIKRRTLNMYNITSPYIFYYGGLEANKNVDQIVKAFAEISDRYPSLKVVIGGGEFKLGWDHKAVPQNERAEKLLRLIKDLQIQHRVTFTGFIDAQHLPVILRYASCFIHLSRYEGFGLSVLEPQLVGTPVIAANRSSYPEVLQDSAILVDPDNTAAIAEQLVKLLNSDRSAQELRNDLATKGQANVKRYNWNKSAAIVLQTIKTALKEQTVTPTTQTKAQPVALKQGGDSSSKTAVVIAAYFHPFVGGMEQVALDYARFLLKAGFQVTVLTSDRKQGQIVVKKTEEYEGLKIVRLQRLGKNYYFYLLKGLYQQLRTLQPDLIHVHGFGFLGHDQAIWRYRRFVNQQVKIVNTPHGPFMSKEEQGIRAIVKAVFTFIQSLYLNRLLDRVIAVNPSQYLWLERRYLISEAKIILLPPVMPQPPVNLAKLWQAKHKKGYIQITSLGRLADYKGYDDLVAAFNEINTATLTKLTIAGKSDNYDKALNKLIGASPRREDISLERDITNARREEILRATDIFVLASAWEAFGIVIAEAMSQGAAIISTTTEGGKFLVETGVNGLLFDYKDIRKLIDNINHLLNDKEKLLSMQTKGVEMVGRYSAKVVAAGYYKLLGSLGFPNLKFAEKNRDD